MGRMPAAPGGPPCGSVAAIFFRSFSLSGVICIRAMVAEPIQDVLKRYWGYDSFLPLQKEAIQATCGGRDTIVVLPTGGGKSACFQIPALVLPGLTIVVSPLLSLMKDQVDDLTELGVAAARIDSAMTDSERRDVFARLRTQDVKVLYVSPERLVNPAFLDFARSLAVSSIAIDEAHCVSMWGHDFRPEYRQLGQLRDAFLDIPIGTYTATATQRVRDDVRELLKLRDPLVLVGRFDRPNLVFRLEQRYNLLSQVRRVLDRHKNESGIIYCIRRSDVDDLCGKLQQLGFRAVPYHAGMDDVDRKGNQEAFVAEKVDIVVATVAFGMGIDKSNVRFVMHTGMPKSIEHYQQETGRAGRDGLGAECVLFFSPSDYHTWKFILENAETSQGLEIHLRKLSQVYSFCTSYQCRHRAVSRYFGQNLDRSNCMACDVCLEDLEPVPEPLIVAQKILSSVIRQGEAYGAEYTAGVLTGAKDPRIVGKGHDRLSTYGLLKEMPKHEVRELIEQLVSLGALSRTEEYRVLKVTPKGRQILRGEESPALMRVARKTLARVAGEDTSWEDVDRALFEELRQWRLEQSAARRVPAYVIFSDSTLRDLARWKPVEPPALEQISGFGRKKILEYGTVVLRLIREYADQHEIKIRGLWAGAGPPSAHQKPLRRQKERGRL
jgi:ATP-dependent DNA helicase RecQ